MKIRNLKSERIDTREFAILLVAVCVFSLVAWTAGLLFMILLFELGIMKVFDEGVLQAWATGVLIFPCMMWGGEFVMVCVELAFMYFDHLKKPAQEEHA